MKIRKARKEDFEQYYKLDKKFGEFDKICVIKNYRKYLEWDDKLAKREKKKDFEKIIKKKNTLFLVAEDNKNLIGFIIGEIYNRPKFYKIKKNGFIGDIFVTKKHRGKGIALKLKNKLFKWFKDNKIKSIRLNVFSENKYAIKIYKKWGFKILSYDMWKELK